MTDTPMPRFVVRPTVPVVGSPGYNYWAKEQTIAYEGGTLTSAYGNLIQTLALGSLATQCAPPTRSVSVTSSTVVRTIGQPGSSRKAYTFVKKQYRKKNGGAAAAGEVVRIVTSVGEYDARLTGSMQALADYLCANRAAIYDPFTVYSPAGAAYGPFTAAANP